MNRFEESNYYEILEIAVDASLFEIKRAYRNALELYNEDSLPTYSLFSGEERANIIKKIKHAYNTLTDKTKRAENDLALRDQSTLTDSNEEHNIPLTSYGKDNKDDFIDNENDDSSRPDSVARPGETPQKTLNETHTRKSSIGIDDVSKQKLHEKSVENDGFGLTRSLRSKVCFKMFVFVSVLALVLIALAAMLGPLDLPDRYDFLFDRGESHLEQKRKQARVELTYVESRKDEIKEEQEKSAYMALIETEPISSVQKNPVLHENLASLANIRSEPTIDSEIISKIPRGEEVYVVGKDGEWARLKLTNDNIGWIHQSLIRKRSTITSGSEVGQ